MASGVFAKVVIGSFLLATGFVIGLLGSPVFDYARAVVSGRPIQTLRPYQFGHYATLYKKINLADINFIVTVDGETVYVSPDFVHLPDHLYRETLVWDKTERVVVLELLGKRVFAYDAVNKRSLGKGELRAFEFYPALSDDYFYAPIKDLDAPEDK